MSLSGLKILYVEDDAETASTVSRLVEAQSAQIDWASDGASGLAYAGRKDYDLIILDRMLPDMTGIDIVERLRDAGAEAPVLMVSALGRTENRVEGLDAGVDDYIAKPFEPAELIARIKALHRRMNGNVHSAVIIFGDMECQVKARTVHRQGRHVPLSPKEFNLFRYLMENAGETVSREMLLQHVWKLNFDPQTNVIDVNIGRLRKKLEDGFDSPVLETIWGSGYRLIAQPPKKANDAPLTPEAM